MIVEFKFVDLESGVKEYVVKVFSLVEDVYGFFSFNGNVFIVVLILVKDFDGGRRYFVNVIVVNGVGLEIIMKLDGFIVDILFLVCLYVWDG